MLTVVIQAGGQSTRMGEDKALKSFLGRPLIQRVMDRMTPIADEIIVTTNHPADYTFLKPAPRPGPQTGSRRLGRTLHRALFCDCSAGGGGGLRYAFRQSHALRRRAQAPRRGGSGCRHPKTDEGYEPIHAIYRRATCLPAIESAIEADQWKVISWFPQVKVRTLTPEEIRLYDPSGLAFWNLNTPEEFAEAERRASGQ